MKELLWLNEAIVWCFFVGIGVTGFLCGLVFRRVCGRIHRKREERTVYMAVQEGTVPMEGVVLDCIAGSRPEDGGSEGRG